MNIVIFQLLFYMLRPFYGKLTLSVRLPLAQALLESASFTSPVFRSTNNMFGMMLPKARNTTAIGHDKNGYAVYRSPVDSLRDYLLYLVAFECNTDADLDARLAAGKYAEDAKYYPKVLGVAATIQQKLLNPATVAAQTALGLGAALTVGSVIKKAVK